jgi:hypothetical protein
MADLTNFDELYPPETAVPQTSTLPIVPGTPPQQPDVPGPSYGDYATDIGKSAAITGPVMAATGLLGFPRTALNLADRFNDYTASLLGKPAAQIAADRVQANQASILKNTFPSPEDLQSALEQRTGPVYQPQTVPGQYAASVSSALATAPLGPGSLAGKVLNAVGSGLGSEALGQYFKGYGIEPVMRVLGSIGGGLAGAKGLTPAAAATPERVANVAILKDAGIPLSAGDIAGSRIMRTIESSAADLPLSGFTAQQASEKQAKALGQYVTDAAFDPNKLTAPSSTRGPLPAGSTLPAQNVMAKGAETLADERNSIINPNQLDSQLPLPGGGTVGSKLQSDLLAHETGYYGMGMPSEQSQRIANARSAIVDALIAGKGKISGPQYQALRTDLVNIEDAGYANGQIGADPRMGAAAKGMKQSLDEAFSASLSPEAAQALALNNQRYAIMKQLEPVVKTSGEYMTPSQIARAVSSGRDVPYTRGLGALDQVANAAQSVLRPLPNSMTPARTFWSTIGSAIPFALGAGAHAGSGGSAVGSLGILAGAAIPHVLGLGVVSRPGQAWLGNTILPQRSRDVITQALVNQAATQPVTSDQNDAAAAAFNAQRDQHLRDIGLAPGGAPSGFSQ